MIGRGAVFAGWMACLAACDPGESGESGDINPVTRAAADSAGMAAVGVFKVGADLPA